MGLSLIVGIVPQMRATDEERAEYYIGQFTKINHALRAAKAPEHSEPPQPPAGVPATWDMGNYSTLHYLRRTAAYICLRNALPKPGNDEAASDTVNEQWRMWATTHQPKGLVATLFGERSPVPFEHLMSHSDADGFYLPIKLARVVVASAQLDIAGGGLIGSSIALRDECVKVAGSLGLPLDTDPQSEEVQSAVAHQGEAESGWQRWGCESFACLSVYQAADASVKSGCALVFN